MKIAVAGGGAAGFFGAIAAAEAFPNSSVQLFEATSTPLDKVSISGGGRCNVTHACFDPKELSQSYPRGGRELIGPFTRFQPKDTIDWFARRGVQVKRENDGRMFPVSDDSATIVNCLRDAAQKAGVNISLNSRILNVAKSSGDGRGGQFEVEIADRGIERFDRLLLATGSSPQGYRMAAALEHTITPLAPSLFTFKIKDPRLEGLAGLSVEQVALAMEVDGKTFAHEGPLLITHWGMSGPAVLKLSAWGARALKDSSYKATLQVNWLGSMTAQETLGLLNNFKDTQPRKMIHTSHPDAIPRRLWERLTEHAGISYKTTWANVTRQQSQALAKVLTQDIYHIEGKGVFKEEFVTCGGVDLKEINFKTMQSKICPGLFLAGEILDIDGITGGFNFQAAWTTGWVAGQHIGQR